MALFAGSTGIYLFFEKLWIAIINTMQSPTSLWATTALVLLLAVYIHLKTKRNRSLNTPTKTTELIETGHFKWKTIIHQNGDFEVHPIPYCKVHERKLVPYRSVYLCPAIQLGCKSQIKKRDIKVEQDTAKSFIEGMIDKNLC